jgi:signal transduction histidine kinase
MLEESFQIIDSLLFYSRLKSPQHKKISVHSLLEDCIDTMQELRINKKIAVSKDIDSLKDNLISADPSQIKGVFTNILNNAADAVPDRTGKIEVKAKVYHELIKIHIADNGNGIAKSDLKKVFEPFFTTKAKGTGLGLTVSKHIVKMHGGFINIKSHKGKGTSAIITLPIEEPEKVIK